MKTFYRLLQVTAEAIEKIILTDKPTSESEDFQEEFYFEQLKKREEQLKEIDLDSKNLIMIMKELGAIVYQQYDPVGKLFDRRI